MDWDIAHIIYALGAITVVMAMLFRKGVIIPSLVTTFLLGWAYKGGFGEGIIAGLAAIYNANIMAAKELFSIILLIAFMVGMLNALKELGADRKMIAPIQRIMVNGHAAYWILFIATALLSTAFWPTPAVPLVAAVLIPVALRVGLPPMGIAIAITLAGQGMALSADALMQVAPALSAKAAGMPQLSEAIWIKSIILTLIVGGVASIISYVRIAKTIKKPKGQGQLDELDEKYFEEGEAEAAATLEFMPQKESGVTATFFAIFTIVMFLLDIVAMSMFDIKGGDAGALIGGTAAIIMLVATIVRHRGEAFEEIGERLTEGFGFAIKIMGSIIPIAAFFFLGGQEHSTAVFGEGAPGFLFDIVEGMQAYIPSNEFIAAFGVLLVGIVCGIDGSGFAGLPITGALAGALSHGTGIDTSMLAAVGQMGSIWSGGGTFIAWSSLIAVAAFVGVSPIELARKNFLPVMIGLILATILAVVIW
ncbi:hypothetical protein [Aneurinibacillus aneurinilyticus]|uniref:Uncharacterized protein n=2 Tax=Aneurinibacillus aneurinilyticus TaxID=1391 RepID=A0A848CLH8_ANEAE|nr:hypothetical protein [Aneurinibacillus aneurinilyticus]ERI05879.1 hypothetical protein HMPREF0083_05441 [Aneurinibacillus aneurinilyticus ATCC 12856]MED0672774.1 hypothetical protein [Aneurinibacillus aneurinilyticus]MED0708601.1 hypothetical protein [Aneurinibacillus aneurinilyticus]MED0721761.1 hypothetical protein [Aneurinibacillus aneurinilyticus]MED0731885.1 hypothetical protein [Aneurinibacillus aneurinilyticus]